jgi:hypothetical protein
LTKFQMFAINSVLFPNKFYLKIVLLYRREVLT